MDLLTVGEAFEDLIFAGLPRLPRLGEELRVATLSRHPGGGAVITAIAAARLGLVVGTISALSRDTAAALRSEGIAVVNLRQPPERAAVTVALSTPRDRAFVTFDGVNTVLQPRLLAAIGRIRRAPRHVHFALVPRPCRAWLPVVERLARRGATTSWDFGWHDELPADPALPLLLERVDWVFVNEMEATLYTRARSLRGALKRWRSLARGVVVKRGARGATVVSGSREVHVRARRTRVVDTTGAGDSFNAGFLSALRRGAAIDAAARLGAYIGHKNVGAAGGIDGLPRRHELPQWARRTLEGR